MTTSQTELCAQARACAESGLPWTITLSAQEFLSLAATEPVADGEVVQRAARLRDLSSMLRGTWGTGLLEAAALLERLARDLAEARKALEAHRLPPTSSIQGRISGETIGYCEATVRDDGSRGYGDNMGGYEE